MYSITGITGKVGGVLAKTLLKAGLPVRAVVRDAQKAQAWKDCGCDIAVAEMEDVEALASAFTGAEGVFILPPSDFDPEPGYPSARRVIAAVRTALEKAQPARIICLSTIGADATEDNLLSQRTLMEEALGSLAIPVTFLRAAWFLDNAAWDIPSAKNEGVIHSFLMPLDRKIAMVATKDVGQTAAELIRERWAGVRIVRLEGPERVSPNDLAAAFSETLGHPVRAEVVSRDTWEDLFRGQGMQHPGPRMRMLDGFNEGWIDFRVGGEDIRKGLVDVREFIAEMVKSV